MNKGVDSLIPDSYSCGIIYAINDTVMLKSFALHVHGARCEAARIGYAPS